MYFCRSGALAAKNYSNKHTSFQINQRYRGEAPLLQVNRGS